MVQFLIEKGAQIDSKTRDGLTPLHCAARSGHDQVVDLLVENKAPLCSKTKVSLSITIIQTKWAFFTLLLIVNKPGNLFFHWVNYLLVSFPFIEIINTFI